MTLEKNGWEIIHEMDDDDGSPNCYGKIYGDRIWWAVRHPDSCWWVETKIRGSEGDIDEIKKFKSAKAAIKWIEQHHDDDTFRLEEMLDRLYALTEKENEGIKLSEDETREYIQLVDAIHEMGEDIPFGIEL